MKYVMANQCEGGNGILCLERDWERNKEISEKAGEPFTVVEHFEANSWEEAKEKYEKFMGFDLRG